MLFYKNFKSKYRNDYYYFRSIMDPITKYFTINLIKFFLFPFFIFLFPLYKYFHKNKIYFLCNIMPGVGHIIPEFDFFYLKYNDYKKVIFINNGNKNYNLISDNYKFYKIYSGKFFFIISLFLNFYPKLNLIASQSFTDNNISINFFSKKYMVEYYFKYYSRYFKLRQRKNSFFKLLLKNNEINNPYLQSKNKKIACIHYRENISHSVPQISDPSTYIKSINFLLKNDFQVYFIGRESMPPQFKNLNMINYASKTNNTLFDDLMLVYASDINIVCGSGISYLADSLDKKYLYINSWHISRPGGIGKKSIFVPSLIKNIHSNQTLNIYKQAKLENSNSHIESLHINRNQYKLIHPTEEDIYEGLLELIDIENSNLSNLQIEFKQLIKNYGFDNQSDSRISHNFVYKNRHLMP